MIVATVLGLAVIGGSALDTNAASGPALRLEKITGLPNVKGRIDHMAADVPGSRLFVAAIGNNTVEVIDLASGKHLRSLEGFKEPQGVVYIPEVQKLIVTNGGDGSCQVFDGKTFQLLDTIEFENDADNIRYDTNAKQVYVGFGHGSLVTLDAATGKRIWSVDLGGHPESFQVEQGGTRVFANVPSRGEVVVVDKTQKQPTTSWPLKDLKDNFPMALDSANHRLFVGCRNPAKIAVFDTGSGNLVVTLSIPGDIDDLFYDAKRKRLYGSCGEGYIAVFDQVDSNYYTHSGDIPTAKGARTSLFVPEKSRLYLAVPHRGAQEAEIYTYSVD